MNYTSLAKKIRLCQFLGLPCLPSSLSPLLPLSFSLLAPAYLEPSAVLFKLRTTLRLTTSGGTLKWRLPLDSWRQMGLGSSSHEISDCSGDGLCGGCRGAHCRPHARPSDLIGPCATRQKFLHRANPGLKIFPQQQTPSPFIRLSRPSARVCVERPGHGSRYSIEVGQQGNQRPPFARRKS